MQTYQFVIFGCDLDYITAAFSDLEDMENAVYYKTELEPYIGRNRIRKNIYRLHTTTKTGIRLPFQKVWNPLILKNWPDTKDPVCVLFLGTGYEKLIRAGFPAYLKKRNPYSKCVRYFMDIDNLYNAEWGGYLTKGIDLSIIYSRGAAERYKKLENKECKVLYYPLVFSEPRIKQAASGKECDLYFAGAAKDRLEYLQQICGYLSAKGVNCQFHIVVDKELPESSKKYKDHIHYRTQYFSYEENLERASQAKCLLELSKLDADGETLRMCEAVMLGKKLLTNVKEVQNERFYRKEYMKIFTRVEEIDADFIMADEKVVYQHRELLSPRMLFTELERYFAEPGERKGIGLAVERLNGNRL